MAEKRPVIIDATGQLREIEPPDTVAAAILPAGSYPPLTVFPGEVFLVPENRQVLYSIPIENEGIIEMDGYLVHVHGVTP
jgi:hypothetical protein